MENQDFFHKLPDEVTQLIFSLIKDYSTLIHCMSVSRAFRQQAACVPSLSIVCPGSFSSYDERLHRIFTMVKAFKNLQSLVVRVGQPREEPPSWARCMRYAEIGGSVEKFMFMAAKCGDFSELDSTLLGLDRLGERLQGASVAGSHTSTCLTEIAMHSDLDRKDSLGSCGNASSIGRDRGAWIYESGVERIIPIKSPVLAVGNIQEENKLQPPSNTFDAPKRRQPLSQFSLRQVIAPSNDVLKRMLPVIHFAIVQGLNELRDSLPAFLAQFTDLRAFLLVDMVESITVFMREHHIQELKSTYLQELDELPSHVKEVPDFLPQIITKDSPEGLSNKMEGEEHNSTNELCEVLGSRYTSCSQKLEDVRVDSDQLSGIKDSLLKGPQSSSSTSSLFQSYDRKDSQALKGKEKLGAHPDFDCEGEDKVAVSDWSGMDTGKHVKHQSFGEGKISASNNHYIDVRSNDPESLADMKDAGEGSSFGRCSSYLSNETHPSEGENMFELCGHSSALDASGSSIKHITFSEAVTEHIASVDGKLGCEGEGNDKARINGSRLQGSKCSREQLANKYSLRRCLKSDTWRKKDCTSLRLSTGVKETGCLVLGNFPEQKADIHRSEVPACETAFKEEIIGVDPGAVEGAPTCMATDRSTEHEDDMRGSIRGTESEGDLCESVHNHAYVNEVDFLVDSSQRNHRVGTSGDLPGILQSQVDCDPVGERVVQVDSWQERVRRLRNCLHVDQGPGHNRTDDDRQGPGHNRTNDDRQGPGHNRTDDDRQGQTSDLERQERAFGSDAWRQVWQERVRRLRDSLHVGPGQEMDQNHENRRERLRDLVLRKRHRAMEKDALSFDYTFWRAEQVSSCDYVMSDVSMCIATHAARPLGEDEKEVLLQAAIAGPLLVATVSHVNNHYACHHL